MYAVLASAAAEPGGGLAGLAYTVMNYLGEALGGPGAGIANALDSILPFLPSEVILPLAGVSAHQGHMTLAAAIAWCTLGSVLGSLVTYWIGAALGIERTRALAARIPFVKAEEIARTEAWFERHGTKAVFFGRMVPLFRILISIPAGIERMSIWLFVLLSGAGSLIWNTLFIVAGFQLGQHWEVVEQYGSYLTDAVLVAVVVLVAVRVVKRVRGRTEAAPEPGGTGADAPQPAGDAGADA